MPIAVFVDDLESVDEGLRDEYTKTEDGKFILTSVAETLQGYVKAEDVTSHPDVANLKSALDKERDTRKGLERAVRDLESKADNLTEEEKKELADLRQIKADAEEARKRKEGEFDKWREDIKAENDREKSELVKERDELRDYVCRSQVSRDIAEACNEFGGRANILEPLVQRAVDASYEDGKVSVSVKDSDGTRILDENAQPLSIKGYVERMSKDKEFLDLFASTRNPTTFLSFVKHRETRTA